MKNTDSRPSLGENPIIKIIRHGVGSSTTNKRLFAALVVFPMWSIFALATPIVIVVRGLIAGIRDFPENWESEMRPVHSLLRTAWTSLEEERRRAEEVERVRAANAKRAQDLERKIQSAPKFETPPGYGRIVRIGREGEEG